MKTTQETQKHSRITYNSQKGTTNLENDHIISNKKHQGRNSSRSKSQSKKKKKNIVAYNQISPQIERNLYEKGFIKNQEENKDFKEKFNNKNIPDFTVDRQSTPMNIKKFSNEFPQHFKKEFNNSYNIPKEKDSENQIPEKTPENQHASLGNFDMNRRYSTGYYRYKKNMMKKGYLKTNDTGVVVDNLAKHTLKVVDYKQNMMNSRCSVNFTIPSSPITKKRTNKSVKIFRKNLGNSPKTTKFTETEKTTLSFYKAPKSEQAKRAPKNSNEKMIRRTSPSNFKFDKEKFQPKVKFDTNESIKNNDTILKPEIKTRHTNNFSDVTRESGIRFTNIDFESRQQVGRQSTPADKFFNKKDFVLRHHSTDNFKNKDETRKVKNSTFYEQNVRKLTNSSNPGTSLQKNTPNTTSSIPSNQNTATKKTSSQPQQYHINEKSIINNYDSNKLIQKKKKNELINMELLSEENSIKNLDEERFQNTFSESHQKCNYKNYDFVFSRPLQNMQREKFNSEFNYTYSNCHKNGVRQKVTNYSSPKDFEQSQQEKDVFQPKKQFLKFRKARVPVNGLIVSSQMSLHDDLRIPIPKLNFGENELEQEGVLDYSEINEFYKKDKESLKKTEMKNVVGSKTNKKRKVAKFKQFNDQIILTPRTHKLNNHKDNIDGLDLQDQKARENSSKNTLAPITDENNNNSIRNIMKPIKEMPFEETKNTNNSDSSERKRNLMKKKKLRIKNKSCNEENSKISNADSKNKASNLSSYTVESSKKELDPKVTQEDWKFFKKMADEINTGFEEAERQRLQEVALEKPSYKKLTQNARTLTLQKKVNEILHERGECNSDKYLQKNISLMKLIDKNLANEEVLINLQKKQEIEKFRFLMKLDRIASENKNMIESKVNNIRENKHTSLLAKTSHRAFDGLTRKPTQGGTIKASSKNIGSDSLDLTAKSKTVVHSTIQDKIKSNKIEPKREESKHDEPETNDQPVRTPFRTNTRKTSVKPENNHRLSLQSKHSSLNMKRQSISKDTCKLKNIKESKDDTKSNSKFSGKHKSSTSNNPSVSQPSCSLSRQGDSRSSRKIQPSQNHFYRKTLLTSKTFQSDKNNLSREKQVISGMSLKLEEPEDKNKYRRQKSSGAH